MPEASQRWSPLSIAPLAGAARLVLTVLAIAACGAPAPPAGEPAPDFRLRRFDGVEVSLESLRGKWVLIDFWATWCPPCVLEIPELNALWDTHRSEDFTLLAVSIDTDDPADVAAWVADKGVRYPVAIAELELATAYGAEQFPFHLLVGPDGTIRERLAPGYHDREELGALLARHRDG